MKDMNKKYIVIGLVLILISCIGISIAYFVGLIGGKETNISVSSKEINIIFTDTTEIAGYNVRPDWNTYKTFTVENKSNDVFFYNISIKELINTLVTDSLEYKITSDTGYNMKDFEPVQKCEEECTQLLAKSVVIEKGELQTYKIEFRYLDDPEIDQSEDMGKTFSGRLAIEEGDILPKVKLIVVNGSGSSSKYAEKEEVAFTGIRPNETYDKDKVTYNCDNGAIPTLEEETLRVTNITKDTICRVEYSKYSYNVAVEVTGGIVTGSPKEVEHGEDATFTITASTGYNINTAIVSDCDGTISPGTLNNAILTVSNITSETTCKITIEKLQYNVIVNVENGEVDESPKSVEYGGNVTFTITASDGFDLSKATINEECIEIGVTLEDGTLTINNVTSAITCDITIPEKGILAKDFGSTKYPDATKRTDFSNIVTAGLVYYEDGAYTEDGNKVYYFAGNVTNNWVKFAGFYWRIIRTNEDGSLRLLYAGDSPSTTIGYINNSRYQYNSANKNTMYVGYMYGSTGSLAKNRGYTTSSPIKQTIDSWYSSTIAPSYGDYVSKTAIYCNDRSGQGYNATSSMYYAAYNRLVNNKRPSFKCGNNQSGKLYTDNNVADKFSASTTSGGNGQLDYPVSLITADEVEYAGGVFRKPNKNTYYYLNSLGESVTALYYWWTISPGYFSPTTSTAQVYVVRASNSDPGDLYMVDVDSSYAVRPVLSLKSCVTLSGSGVINDEVEDPYIPSIDSTCASAEN